jgi:hypothetical protein
MTLKEARKRLGKAADNLSDKDLLAEINNAAFLVELIFKEYKKTKLVSQR